MSDIPDVLGKLADNNFAPATVEYNALVRASIHIMSAEAEIERLTAENERLTEALRYTAFYGSSVPLGMPAGDYYHGAMNDLINHAACTLHAEETAPDEPI